MSETSAESSPKPPPPRYRIYSPAAVTWATVIGSVAAGGAVLALNYWRWGQKREAWGSFICGILLVVVLLGISQQLPNSIPSAALLVPQFFIARELARRWQGRRVDAHIAAGGKMASNWAAAGIGAVYAFFTIAGLIGWVMMGEPEAGNKGERLEVGADQEIVYSDGATRETAEHVRDALKELGLFSEGHAMTVYLAGTGEEKSLSFIVRTGAWDDLKNVEGLQKVAEAVAPALGGKPLTLRLLDDALVERKRIRID